MALGSSNELDETPWLVKAASLCDDVDISVLVSSDSETD